MPRKNRRDEQPRRKEGTREKLIRRLTRGLKRVLDAAYKLKWPFVTHALEEVMEEVGRELRRPA